MANAVIVNAFRKECSAADGLRGGAAGDRIGLLRDALRRVRT